MIRGVFDRLSLWHPLCLKGKASEDLLGPSQETLINARYPTSQHRQLGGLQFTATCRRIGSNYLVQLQRVLVTIQMPTESLDDRTQGF